MSPRRDLHPVWGHEATRRMLGRARHEGRLPSALLLHGPRGVGKQRLALWAAQLVLCEAPVAAARADAGPPAEIRVDEGLPYGGVPDGWEPCGACHACRLVLRLQHPDLHWHFPLPRPKGVSADRLGDALEQTRAEHLEETRARPIRWGSVDEPKELSGIYLAAVQTIRRRAQSRPAMGPEQVFVIGEAEELVAQEASQEAANALLKLLEEPPRDTRLILTSSEPGRLLPTVRSRTVPLHVGPLGHDLVRDFLERQTGVEHAAAERAARLGAGSIGRALGFLPGTDGPGPLDRTRMAALELLGTALSPRREEAFALALSYAPTRARHLVELLDFLDEALRDLGALAAGVPERAADPEAVERLGRATREGAVHPSNVARSLSVVERARELARGNVNPQLLVTGLMAELRATLLGQPATLGAMP